MKYLLCALLSVSAISANAAGNNCITTLANALGRTSGTLNGNMLAGTDTGRPCKVNVHLKGAHPHVTMRIQSPRGEKVLTFENITDCGKSREGIVFTNAALALESFGVPFIEISDNQVRFGETQLISDAARTYTRTCLIAN